MVLRIGVEDGEEATARIALATAAKGCVEMFQNLRTAWSRTVGAHTILTSCYSQFVIKHILIKL